MYCVLLLILRSWTRLWYKPGRKTSESSLSRPWSSAPSYLLISPSFSSTRQSSSLWRTSSTRLDDWFTTASLPRRHWRQTQSWQNTRLTC